MLLPRLALCTALLLAACLAGGCARGTSCQTCAGYLPAPTEPDLNAPGELSVDLAGFTSAADRSDPPPKPQPGPYHLLSAADCQCLAASHAIIGNLAQLERTLASQDCDSHSAAKRQIAAIQSQLLILRENQDRNRAAGDALTAYYQLLEVEHAIDSIRNSNDLLTTTIEGVGDNAATFGIDITAIRRSRLEILASLDDLHGKRHQLNEQLSYLIGRNYYERSPIWPTETLAPDTEPVDAESAVADALSMRSELAAVRLLLSTLDAASVDVAARFLSQTDQSLGSTGGGGFILGCQGADCDVAIRRTQLIAIQTDLQRRIAAEVRAAIASLAAASGEVRQRQGIIDNWERRIRQLAALQGNGQITAFDVRSAQIELHSAKRELTSAIAAWHVARVELSRAQGWLAVECGYTSPVCRGGRTMIVSSHDVIPLPPVE